MTKQADTPKLTIGAPLYTGANRGLWECLVSYAQDVVGDIDVTLDKDYPGYMLTGASAPAATAVHRYATLTLLGGATETVQAIDAATGRHAIDTRNAGIDAVERGDIVAAIACRDDAQRLASKLGNKATRHYLGVAGGLLQDHINTLSALIVDKFLRVDS